MSFYQLVLAAIALYAFSEDNLFIATVAVGVLALTDALTKEEETK